MWFIWIGLASVCLCAWFTHKQITCNCLDQDCGPDHSLWSCYDGPLHHAFRSFIRSYLTDHFQLRGFNDKKSNTASHKRLFTVRRCFSFIFSLYITLFNVVGDFSCLVCDLNCSDQDRFISPVTVYDILTTRNVHHFELIYLQFVSMNSEALKHKKSNMVSVKVLFTVRRFFPFLFAS